MGPKRKRSINFTGSNKRSATKRARDGGPVLGEPDVWLVEGILDETTDKYLVAWAPNQRTGEKYDPSWEPRAAVNQIAIDEWESKKRPANGESSKAIADTTASPSTLQRSGSKKTGSERKTGTNKDISQSTLRGSLDNSSNSAPSKSFLDRLAGQSVGRSSINTDVFDDSIIVASPSKIQPSPFSHSQPAVQVVVDPLTTSQAASYLPYPPSIQASQDLTNTAPECVVDPAIVAPEETTIDTAGLTFGGGTLPDNSGQTNVEAPAETGSSVSRQDLDGGDNTAPTTSSLSAVQGHFIQTHEPPEESIAREVTTTSAVSQPLPSQGSSLLQEVVSLSAETTTPGSSETSVQLGSVTRSQSEVEQEVVQDSEGLQQSDSNEATANETPSELTASDLIVQAHHITRRPSLEDQLPSPVLQGTAPVTEIDVVDLSNGTIARPYTDVNDAVASTVIEVVDIDVIEPTAAEPSDPPSRIYERVSIQSHNEDRAVVETAEERVDEEELVVVEIVEEQIVEEQIAEGEDVQAEILEKRIDEQADAEAEILEEGEIVEEELDEAEDAPRTELAEDLAVVETVIGGEEELARHDDVEGQLAEEDINVNRIVEERPVGVRLTEEQQPGHTGFEERLAEQRPLEKIATVETRTIEGRSEEKHAGEMQFEKSMTNRGVAVDEVSESEAMVANDLGAQERPAPERPTQETLAEETIGEGPLYELRPASADIFGISAPAFSAHQSSTVIGYSGAASSTESHEITRSQDPNSDSGQPGARPEADLTASPDVGADSESRLSDIQPAVQPDTGRPGVMAIVSLLSPEPEKYRRTTTVDKSLPSSTLTGQGSGTAKPLWAMSDPDVSLQELRHANDAPVATKDSEVEMPDAPQLDHDVVAQSLDQHDLGRDPVTQIEAPVEGLASLQPQMISQVTPDGGITAGTPLTQNMSRHLLETLKRVKLKQTILSPMVMSSSKSTESPLEAPPSQHPDTFGSAPPRPDTPSDMPSFSSRIAPGAIHGSDMLSRAPVHETVTSEATGKALESTRQRSPTASSLSSALSTCPSPPLIAPHGLESGYRTERDLPSGAADSVRAHWAGRTAAGKAVYRVPVPMLPAQLDQYCKTLDAAQNLVEECSTIPLSARQVEVAQYFLHRLELASVHPDLVDDDTAGEDSTPPIRKAEWDRYCSGKFMLLRSLLKQLDECNVHIVIGTSTKRLRKIMTAFLAGLGIKHRNASSTTDFAIENDVKITLVMPHEELPDSPAVDAMISVDNEPADARLSLRARRDGTLAPLFVFVHPYSVTHVRYACEDESYASLDLASKTALLMSTTAELQGRLVKATLSDRLNDEPYKNTASEMASFIRKRGQRRDWSLAGLEPLTPKAPAMIPKATALGDQSETKRGGEELATLGPNASTYKASVDLAQQASTRPATSEREAMLRAEISALHRRLTEYETALANVQFRYEKQRTEITRADNDKAGALTEVSNAVAQTVNRDAIIEKLKLDRDDYKQQLSDAKDSLTKNAPPATAAFESLAARLDTSQRERARLESRATSLQNETDYIRGLYQEASSQAAILSQENTALESRIVDLERAANENIANVRRYSRGNRERRLFEQLNATQAALFAAERTIQQQRDETQHRTTRESRGGGSRYGAPPRPSEVPRSPIVSGSPTTTGLARTTISSGMVRPFHNRLLSPDRSGEGGRAGGGSGGPAGGPNGGRSGLGLGQSPPAMLRTTSDQGYRAGGGGSAAGQLPSMDARMRR